MIETSAWSCVAPDRYGGRTSCQFGGRCMRRASRRWRTTTLQEWHKT